jgi:hypothetical protein
MTYTTDSIKMQRTVERALRFEIKAMVRHAMKAPAVVEAANRRILAEQAFHAADNDLVRVVGAAMRGDFDVAIKG